MPAKLSPLDPQPRAWLGEATPEGSDPSVAMPDPYDAYIGEAMRSPRRRENVFDLASGTRWKGPRGLTERFSTGVGEAGNMTAAGISVGDKDFKPRMASGLQKYFSSQANVEATFGRTMGLTEAISTIGVKDLVSLKSLASDPMTWSRAFGKAAKTPGEQAQARKFLHAATSLLSKAKGLSWDKSQAAMTMAGIPRDARMAFRAPMGTHQTPGGPGIMASPKDILSRPVLNPRYFSDTEAATDLMAKMGAQDLSRVKIAEDIEAPYATGKIKGDPENHLYHVEKSGGKVIGMVKVAPKPDDTYHITNFWVRPGQRSKGTGTKLMKRVVDLYGDQTLTLDSEVFDKSPLTQGQLDAFYEKFNFVKTKGLRMIRDPGLEKAAGGRAKLAFPWSKKEEKPSPLNSSVPAAVLGGVGIGGHALKTQMESAGKRTDKWVSKMDAHKSIMALPASSIAQQDAALQAYIGGARDLANTRVMGPKAGSLVGAVRGSGNFVARIRDTFGLLGKDKAEELRFRKAHPWEALRHYQKYISAPPEALARHHHLMALDDLVSGLTNGTSKNPAAAGLKAIFSGEGSLASKLETVGKEHPSHLQGVQGAIKSHIQSLTGSKNSLTGVDFYSELSKRLGTRLGRTGGAARAVALPAAALFAGKALYDHRKQAAQAPTDYGLLAGVPSLAAGGVLAGVGLRKVLNPSNRVAVTYGVMPSIGEGHAAPGRAIHEVLQRHPAMRGFHIDKLERDARGLFPDVGPQGRYALGVHTGFGVNDQGWADPLRTYTAGKAQMPSGFRANQDLAYLTDMTDVAEHRSGSTISSLPQAAKGSKWHQRPGLAIRDALSQLGLGGGVRDSGVLHYGPNAEVAGKQIGGASLHSLGDGVTPAMHPDTVRFLQDSQHTRGDILDKLIKNLEATADPYGLQQLEKLKKIKADPSHILLTVAGAGRGDYTASRAAELSDLLMKHPSLKDKASIIAFQAAAHKGPTESLLHGRDNVVSLGKVMPEFTDATKRTLSAHPYAQLQSLSDVNWGATGTSGLHEQLIGKGVQAIPSDWGANLDYGNSNASSFVDGSIADRQNKALAAGGAKLTNKNDLHANVSTWNKGNIEHALQQPGVLKANKAEDIIKVLLDKGLLDKLRTGASTRAVEQAGHYAKGQEAMVQVIKRMAEKGMRQGQLRGVGLGLTGLGLAGLGGSMALQRKSREKKAMFNAVKNIGGIAKRMFQPATAAQKAIKALPLPVGQDINRAKSLSALLQASRNNPALQKHYLKIQQLMANKGLKGTNAGLLYGGFTPAPGMNQSIKGAT